MKTIAIANGPNLNLLGLRENHIYGSKTLDTINGELVEYFADRAKLSFFQSNHEGELIEHIQSLKDIHGLVINPGAFTHTSIAIRDAILAKKHLTVEVHLSNIFAREAFRKHSYISDICAGVISGLGAFGYRLAIEAVLEHRRHDI